MFVKRVRYYQKSVNKYGFLGDYQQIRVTSFWLLGIIPLYIKNEVVAGVAEKK